MIIALYYVWQPMPKISLLDRHTEYNTIRVPLRFSGTYFICIDILKDISTFFKSYFSSFSPWPHNKRRIKHAAMRR